MKFLVVRELEALGVGLLSTNAESYNSNSVTH